MSTTGTTATPVWYRGEVLGHATTQRGALAVAARRLGKLGTERCTAKAVRIERLEPEDSFEGPAWAVGETRRGHHARP